MNLLLTFTFCILPYVYNGFRLDDRTRPPIEAAAVLFDNKFNILLSLLLEEKQARMRLENEVQQLRIELLTTRQGVTCNYHVCQNHNDSFILQSSALKNLDDKYTSLEMKCDSLKLEFSEFQTNFYILQNHTAQIKQELVVLKQLKRATNLQAIASVQDESKHLNKEIQDTNTVLKSVSNSRKQDCVALANKADATKRKLDAIESKLELSVRQIEANLNKTIKNMNTNCDNIDIQLKKIEKSQNLSLTQLSSIQTQLITHENKQNLTTTHLKQELHTLYLEMYDTVAVTACANGQTYQPSSIILYQYLYTRKGISSNGVASLVNSGKFLCERPGLYLITAFIATNTDSSYVYLYQNNDVIASNHFSMNHYLQTHSVSVLRQLNYNDSVYIMTVNSMYIYEDRNSCMSILQING